MFYLIHILTPFRKEIFCRIHPPPGHELKIWWVPELIRHLIGDVWAQHRGKPWWEGCADAPCVHTFVYAWASKLIMKYRLAIGRDHHCPRARVCHVHDLPSRSVILQEGLKYVQATGRGSYFWCNNKNQKYDHAKIIDEILITCVCPFVIEIPIFLCNFKYRNIKSNTYLDINIFL